MRCNHDLLSRYADGELPPESYREVTVHLRSCNSCRKELSDIRRVSHVLYAWGSIRRPLPASTERRIHGSVERRQRFAPLFALSRFAPPAVGSSIAALLLLLTVNAGSIGQLASPTPETHPQTWQHVKKEAQLLQLARIRDAVVTTQPSQLPRISVRRHIEALIN